MNNEALELFIQLSKKSEESLDLIIEKMKELIQADDEYLYFLTFSLSSLR